MKDITILCFPLQTLLEIFCFISLRSKYSPQIRLQDSSTHYMPTPKMVKHTQTICRLLPTNCLSVFDHFVGLTLKGLISISGSSASVSGCNFFNILHGDIHQEKVACETATFCYVCPDMPRHGQTCLNLLGITLGRPGSIPR